MSQKLDTLRELYETSMDIAADVKWETEDLKKTLAAKQELVMESVRKDLREFAGYAAGLEKGWLRLFLDDCTLDFYRSSYGRQPSLIVAFEPDGDVKIKANPDGYSHMADVYELNADRWGWYGKDCKAYVTENWEMIAEKIEDGLARALEKASKDAVSRAVEERDALRESIGAVSENIDWAARKDVVLHNALSLLVEQAYGDEGFDEMLDELGVTREELEQMGVRLEKPLLDRLSDAVSRAEDFVDERGSKAEKGLF